MSLQQQKIAIVTGVSREIGIGAAICNALADSGIHIFFTHWGIFDELEREGQDKSFPSRLQQKIVSKGVQCNHIELDLSTTDSVARLLAEVERTLGVATILINNATYETPTNFRSITFNNLMQHYLVNNAGTILLSSEFAKRFEHHYTNSGRIINLVSGGPDPNNLAYIATKGAIKAITEPLAVGLAPLGITVNSVDPGPTDTGWMNEHIYNHLLPLFPMGRVGQPDDVTKLIKFLVSDDAGWITGQCIHSNGGFIGK